MRTQGVVAFAVAGLLTVAGPAAAQTPAAPPPAAPAAAPAAQAPSAEGGWSISFDVGLDSNLSGEAYNRAQGNALGQPVQVSARTYRRAYGPGLAWSVALGRSLGDRSELRIRVGGNNASGDRRQTGRVGTEDITGTLFSELDKLMEIGVDVGLRRYFGGGTVQPYLGGQVGFARVNAISATFDVPDSTFPFEVDADLYGETSALTAGVSGGFMFNRSAGFGIYVNLDARFRGKLKAEDADLAGTGLEIINDDTARWSTPLSVGARVRF
jgi:hypothetical protein